MKLRTGAVRLLNFRPITGHLGLLSLLAGVNVMGTIACESTDVPPDNGRPTEGATIVLTPANNYAAVADFNIPSVDTPVADLTFTWDAVTSNVLCESINPATEVGGVWLIRVKGKDQAAVTESIESFSLSSFVDVAIGVETAGRTGTQAQLTEMTLTNGDPITVSEFYIPSSPDALYTYMLLFTEGTQIEQDAISMKFLNPVGTGEPIVAGEPGCDANAQPPLLQYTPTLGPPVVVPAAGPWIVDWFGVKNDSQGKPVSYPKLSRLMLAFHEGKDASDFSVQENFFKLETEATLLYELVLGMGMGTSADLSQALLIQNLKDPAAVPNTPFSGFETGSEGVWLMAVMCDSCSNPSPVILSVLQPSP